MSNAGHFLAIVPSPGDDDLLREVQSVRADAVARYTEVDLLVAALREHIVDLKSERDRLRAEVDFLRAQVEEAENRAAARWLVSRQKGPR